MPIYRKGPQPRGPSMCLMHRTTEKDPRQGSPLSAGMGGATEKTLTGPEVLPRRRSVSLNTWPPGAPQAKQLLHLHAQLSLGQGCHRPKKKSLVFMRAGSRRSCQTLCDPVACSLPGFSVREGVLQARIQERMGQFWLPCPSRVLYFLLPWLPTP